MATLVDPPTMRGFVETDLSDDNLQILIDDADAEIVLRFGPHTTAQEWFVDDVPGQFIFPQRSVASVTSIDETIYFQIGVTTWAETTTTLSADDYEITPDAKSIRRLTTGVNGRFNWGERINLIYVPADETARRKRVEIDLVRLALQYDALQQSKDGDHQQQGLDYEAERNRLLARLGQRLWA